MHIQVSAAVLLLVYGPPPCGITWVIVVIQPPTVYHHGEFPSHFIFLSLSRSTLYHVLRDPKLSDPLGALFAPGASEHIIA